MDSQAPSRNGFFIYRGARLEALAGALAGNLTADPPDDVIAPVEIAVGSRGMERWLRHRLAVPLGISANLQFPFPGQAIAAVYGSEQAAVRAWSPEALAWRVLEVLPGLLALPELAALQGWLARESVSGGSAACIGRDRWSLAREVADVLDRACLFRPEWVDAWERNAPIGGSGAPPAWQGLVWRAIRARIPAAHPSPAAVLRGKPLPGPALHVFGVSSMPPAWLEALERAGQNRRVHLYHLTPSDAYWGDLKTAAELRRSGNPMEAEALRVSQNPVLTSLGKLARDGMELILARTTQDVDVPAAFDEPNGHTVLASVQTDVLHARSLDELRDLAPLRPLQPDDDSVQLHACHGPTRQVEALRDALLDLFDQHKHLEPRHVVVMTPDVGLYAPLIRATFAEGPGQRKDLDWGPIGGPAIPTHIADLGLQELNPLADVLIRTLALVDGRLTATALADLAALGPVRRRFGFDDDQLSRIRRWLAEAGARFGADAGERGRHGLPEQHTYTVAFALERLALGVAMQDTGSVLVAGAAPYDEMEGSSTRGFGPFAELCARLDRWRAALRAPRTVAEWAEVLLSMVDELAEVSAKAAFLRTELCEGLEAWKQEAAGFAPQVALSAVSPILTSRFERGRKGDRPATGAVTVCALTPMRSVPFRVVCLLGMDDGVFPRAPSVRAFDAAASHPRQGDRDPREEDRNLLLEALLAAREHFIVCYTGQDPRSGKALAPAVPVGDLLDAIDASVCVTDSEGKPSDRLPRAVLTRTHAVQPFSASGFRASAEWPAAPAPRRFDARMHAAAAALAGARGEGAPFLTFDMEFPESEPIDRVTVAELVEWLRKPLRTLIKRRLGLYMSDYTTALVDRESLSTTSLDTWIIGDRAIEAYRAGARTASDAAALLGARALVPPGAPGRVALATAWNTLELIAADLDRSSVPERRPVDVAVGGVRVVDTLTTHHREVVCIRSSAPTRAADQLSVWVTLVALRAAGHLDVTGARIIGVGGKEPTRQVVVFHPPEDAVAQLATLVGLWRQARTKPLRLVEKTSMAYAAALLAKPNDPAAARLDARKRWVSNTNAPGEDADPALHAVFGAGAPFETADGPSDTFAELAQALWNPILSAQGSAE